MNALYKIGAKITAKANQLQYEVIGYQVIGDEIKRYICIGGNDVSWKYFESIEIYTKERKKIGFTLSIT